MYMFGLCGIPGPLPCVAGLLVLLDDEGGGGGGIIWYGLGGYTIGCRGGIFIGGC